MQQYSYIVYCVINKLLRLQKYINEIAEIFDIIPQNRKTLYCMRFYFIFFFCCFFLSGIHIDITHWHSLIYAYVYSTIYVYLADRNIYISF